MNAPISRRAIATGKFGELSPVITAAMMPQSDYHDSHQGNCDDGVIVEAERTDHDKSP